MRLIWQPVCKRLVSGCGHAAACPEQLSHFKHLDGRGMPAACSACVDLKALAAAYGMKHVLTL